MLLPFTPPSGWTLLPPAAMRTQVKNVWAGPKTASGSHPVFSEVVVPLALPAQPANAQPATFCGFHGMVRTFTAGSGSSRMTTVLQTVARNGYQYMVIYARPLASAPDVRIVARMKQFCPPANGELAAQTPPTGWTAQASLTTVGVWMGNAPMQIMMLAQGPRESSLKDVLSRGNSTQTASNAHFFVTTKPATLCGLPALFVSMKPEAGSALPTAVDAVVTQGDAISYMLTYVHPAGQAPQKAAEDAMQTLCARAPQSALPTAAPAALPTLAPQPSATPFPRERLSNALSIRAEARRRA